MKTQGDSARDHLTVDGVTIWWDSSQPTRMHYTVNDPRFTDAAGERPGIRVVFSSDPKSADYNPNNINRCARALREEGKPAPKHDVPESSRRLRDRFATP